MSRLGFADEVGSAAYCKTRHHLAAIKPQERGLMLEIMHFLDELLDPSDFKQPAASQAVKAEIAMARKLIESMSVTISAFKDEYYCWPDFVL